MTKDITNDRMIWAQRHIGAALKNTGSPELRTLLALANHPASPTTEPGKTSELLKDGRMIKHLPIVIIAGDTDTLTTTILSEFRTLLIEGFHDFTGTIISGGTTAGICGLAGDIQEINQDSITTIGYVPAAIPAPEQVDTRYHEIRKTDGEKFSVLEPLQYWTDILASGIPPSEVKLIGINGGDISALEYRIALLLGAGVGIIEDSGRAAADLLADRDWNCSENLIILPHDGATLRAFIGYGTAFHNNHEREELARQIHEEYLKMQLENSNTDPTDPSLVPWDDLDPGLKDSNRDQADHNFAKLKETGYELRKIKQAKPLIVSFSPEEVEHLAELEHGRWNAERLLAGWKPGPAKDVTHKISPYIVSWTNLPDDVREWDRNTVRQLPEMLAKMGYEMYR